MTEAPTSTGATAPLGQVRAVTYDLWLTLIEDRDGRAVWQERVRRVADLLDLPPERAAAAVTSASRQQRHAWAHGEALSFPEIAAAVLEAAGAPADGPTQAAARAALEEPTAALGVRLLPGARETLDTLRAAGLRLGLICDTGLSSGSLLRRVLASLGVREHFDVVVFSDEVGVPKPGPLPFQRALAGLEVAPHEAVHVGDLREKDVAGARAMGLHTVRYRGARDDTDRAAGRPDADHVIREHRELLALLGLPG